MFVDSNDFVGDCGTEGSWVGAVSSTSTFDVSTLSAWERLGFDVNMSRILRRRSNSAISFPDSGSKSLTEYSRLRLPLTNTPKGFITSRTSTSCPSIVILSFIVAYTGQ